MFEPARYEPFGNPSCVLGLQLCKCTRENSVTPNTNGSGTGMTRATNCNTSDMTSVTSVTAEHVQRSREILEKMTRHDRPSLSKQWLEKQDLLTPRVTPNAISSRIDKIRALRPITKDHHHQDSLFGNSFQSKSFFVVHPEWLSETVDNTDPEPLHRPPWPWEQPRYRQNIQIPITYKADETEEDKNKNTKEDQQNAYTSSELPMQLDAPMCLPIGYTFTHPGIDLTKPYDKQTQFGAPLVDTSVYKLGY